MSAPEVVLTSEEREALGRIVAVCDDEDQSLNDWHHCVGCAYQAQQPCACSGRVWLGDEMAAAVERILTARLAAQAAGHEREVAHWKGRRDAAVEQCRHLHQDGKTREQWHLDNCGAMRALRLSRDTATNALEALAESGAETLAAQCDADDLRSRLYLATARAESAEAAHEALRAGVEALTWFPAVRDTVSGETRPAWRKTHVRVRDIDALLAGDAR